MAEYRMSIAYKEARKADVIWKWESSIFKDSFPYYFNKTTGQYTTITDTDIKSFPSLFEKITDVNDFNCDFSNPNFQIEPILEDVQRLFDNSKYYPKDAYCEEVTIRLKVLHDYVKQLNIGTNQNHQFLKS